MTVAVDTPYLGTPFAPNQTILAVNYDKGGEGVSYHDTTPTNLGGDNYRPGDAVDIEKGGSTGNVVGYTAAGEWLNYTVNVPAAGMFTLSASVANVDGGASFHASEGGKNLTGAMVTSATSGWQTYATVTSASFALPAGVQVIQIDLDKAAANGAIGNLDSFKLAPTFAVKPVESPYLGTPFTTSQTIPAVDYDKGGQGLAYNYPLSTNPGGDNIRPDAVGIQKGGTSGAVIAFAYAGEWLNYTITVPTAGTYMLEGSVAQVEAGGSFHGSVGGTNLTGSIAVPNTGGWNSYATVTSASFTLPAGQTILQIHLDQAAPNQAVANFDWFKVVPASIVTPPSNPLSKPLTWNALANSPVPTIEGGSIGVNGKLYVIGGFNDIGDGKNGEANDGVWRGTNQCEVYNPATNTWSAIAPLPDDETHEQCATDGTYIYVAGGNLYNPVNTYQTFATKETWRYDIATNTWSAFVPLPQPRGAGSMVLLGNELHFIGGVDPSRTPQSTHWELDITSANPQWVLDTAAPVARNHTATFAVDGKIYLMGGRDEGTDTGIPSSTAYSFDPTTSTWTQIASLPKPWAVACYAVVDGYCVIMGGSNDASDAIASVIAYDPTKNVWFNVTSFPSPKIGPNGGIVGNELIVSGGDNNGPQASTYGALLG